MSTSFTGVVVTGASGLAVVAGPTSLAPATFNSSALAVTGNASFSKPTTFAAGTIMNQGFSTNALQVQGTAQFFDGAVFNAATCNARRRY
jgi:hypothetical protein